MAALAIEFKLDYELLCICGEAAIKIKNTTCTGDSLYFCKHCDKTKKLSGKKYCEDCGPYFHRNNKKGHAFDINSENVVAVKDLLETKEDMDKASWGKQVIISLIGVERYNKVAPVIENIPLAHSCGYGATVLYAELSEHFAGNVVSKFAAKNALNMSGVGMIATSIIEVGFHAYRWGTNQISGQEYVRQMGRVVTKNIGSFVGMAGGTQIGAMVGTVYCPGIGTFVGICAGLLLGFFAGKNASMTYDTIFPDGEEAARKECVKEALKYFHYQPNDIQNAAIFSEKELSKRFKRFALDAHPDKRDGDHTEWYILSQHYGLLQSLCNQTNATKKMVDEALTIE